VVKSVANGEISNLLNTFASWNRCFTVWDVAEWSDEAVGLNQLRRSFSDDSRFILLSQPRLGVEYFLPETTLFRWWASFNLRLANIHQPRLTEHQLTFALNSLRPEGPWFTPPVDILAYGQEFGFVTPAWKPESYVFPLAHILSQATSMARRTFDTILADFASPEIRKRTMEEPIVEAIESILSQFDQRTSHIVKAREGLPPYERMTLEELGRVYGCTRERIRQIETKFWERSQCSPIGGLSTITALLAELMRNQGSLVLDSDHTNTPFVCFLAKCLDVPFTRLKAGNFIVMGIAKLETTEAALSRSVNKGTDSKYVADKLDDSSLSYLVRGDLSRLAESLVRDKFSRMNRTEKVYLALKHIGKAANFSEVTETYNLLFRDDWVPERNVHAILSRCADPKVEQYGIVWTGIKGTYALKEHGYERPSLRLFDAVTKVVEEKYKETQKPVHISVITTELGKYRQFVNTGSLQFATGVNPRLERVSKDFFVPKDPQQAAQGENATSDLDRIIREFRAELTLNS
jgi:hypothetical protein